MQFGKDVEGVQTVGEVVHVAGEDQFVRLGLFEQLLEIVKNRLKLSEQFVPFVDPLIKHFEDIRNLALKKKPATAELLAWLAVLNRMHSNNESLGKGEALAFTYSILAKNKEDSELMLALASKLQLQ